MPKHLEQNGELYTRQEWIKYLEETIIPDLKNSGMTATAEDFEMCIRFMKDEKTMIKSIIIWPKEKDGGPYLGWVDECENKSEDTHYSIKAAESVCYTLIRQGFGCDGHINGIYPIAARVEVDGEVAWSWEKGKGGTHNN